MVTRAPDACQEKSSLIVCIINVTLPGPTTRLIGSPL